MGMGIISVFIAVFAIVGAVRQLKIKNLIGGGFGFVTFVVFGWFSVMTIYAAVWGSGATSG